MTSLRDTSATASAEPRLAFGTADVAAALGISPELANALIRLAGTRADAAQSRLAYSPGEVCLLTGLSRDIVNDLIRTGQLGSIKAGRRRLISRDHLDAFLRGGAA